MADLKVMYSSATDLWATPQHFFDELDAEFHFTLDPCALPSNAKCSKFFTPDDNGLLQDWGGRLCFAIRRMGELLAIGYSSVIMRLKSPIQQL